MSPEPPAVRIRSADGGRASLLAVRVQPGARRRGVAGGHAGEHGGALRIAVDAPAVDGKANHQLVRLVAELLGLRPSAVELVRGNSSREKTLQLMLPLEETRRRVARLLTEESR